jgi:hypothetical protein
MKNKIVLLLTCCVILTATGIQSVFAQAPVPIWEEESFWEKSSFSQMELLRMSGFTLDEMYAIIADGKMSEVAYLILTFADTIENIRATYLVNTPPPNATENAAPTASTVLVNGVETAFDAYNIKNNNYFKLRDLAYVLSGTEKQFEVGWDSSNNSISLTSGKPYTTVGGEMTSKGAGVKTAHPTSSKIFLDGKEVAFTAFNIEGNNYFKLRDIGAVFDFGVDWDGPRNTIIINTSKKYVTENSWFDNTIPQNVREAVSNAVTKEWTDTFSVYYKVLSFQANKISYTNIENQVELKFSMTMMTQNFYRDPDTVAYIREAKESGSVHYQQLYEEYNMPKENNFNLMATMSINASGEVEPGTLQLFSNVSPNAENYEPVRADDFIIKG